MGGFGGAGWADRFLCGCGGGGEEEGVVVVRGFLGGGGGGAVAEAKAAGEVEEAIWGL